MGLHLTVVQHCISNSGSGQLCCWGEPRLAGKTSPVRQGASSPLAEAIGAMLCPWAFHVQLEQVLPYLHCECTLEKGGAPHVMSFIGPRCPKHTLLDQQGAVHLDPDVEMGSELAKSGSHSCLSPCEALSKGTGS